MKHDDRHGGPYDRGGADSYYHRAPDPHYYTGDSLNSDRIEKSEMTADEIQAYLDGYEDNELLDLKKEY